MSGLLARNWWAIALRGVAALGFGLVALLVPGAAMLSLALIFAAYLLADGIFGIVSAVRAARTHERWGLLLAEGVLNLLMGLLAAFFPAGAVLGFVLATAAWALLTGGLMLAAAFRLDRSHGRLWLALGGILSLAWGILLVMTPLAGAVVLTWWLGAYAVAFGAALLVLAFRLRRQRDRASPVEPPPRGT
ncbi:HdeD family acid-resistance protein [Muricoccus roseus]|nr:HdeD family acid-resistance protein [Roseomonas rosea]